MNDASIARNIALLTGSVPFDVPHVLDTLGSQRGMLYYHLLLGHLEARNELGRASFGDVPCNVRRTSRSGYDPHIQDR